MQVQKLPTDCPATNAHLFTHFELVVIVFLLFNSEDNDLPL